MDIAQVRLMRISTLIAHTVLRHDRAKAVGERIDRGGANTPGGRTPGHDHRVSLRRRQERNKRRPMEEGWPLLREKHVALVPQALINFGPPRTRCDLGARRQLDRPVPELDLVLQHLDRVIDGHVCIASHLKKSRCIDRGPFDHLRSTENELWIGERVLQIDDQHCRTLTRLD